MLALELPDDWELWVCSPGNENFPRIDAWFELHGDLDFPCEGGRWFRYLDWINSRNFTVYAQDQTLIPRAITFPAEKLCGEFGSFFFTSQPAWMFAFAMAEGAADIGLFGLDMAARSEYAQQKSAISHFCWVASQKKINILAPPESEVLQPPPLYGYSYNSSMGRKLRVRQLEVEAQLRELDQQIEELRMKRQHFRGVLDENDWTQQTWTGGQIPNRGDLIRLKSEG